MSKKMKIISLSLGAAAILGVSAVGAYQASQKEKDLAICIHASTFEMKLKPPRDETEKRRAEQLIAEEEERCRKNVYMSAKEKAKIVAEKKRLHEESLRLQEEER
ncbi:MAG: hypothetical protein MN733_29510, partial [Nitrososphaera sp.]|nr:hypothetical protein [Nitrososphaera sp.]